MLINSTDMQICIRKIMDQLVPLSSTSVMNNGSEYEIDFFNFATFRFKIIENCRQIVYV